MMSHSGIFIDPHLFEEKKGDMVFGFPWFVVHSSGSSDSIYLVSITPSVLCHCFLNCSDVIFYDLKIACDFLD